MSHSLLFVDDEPNIVQSLSLLFDDHKVFTANSGFEALEIFQRGEKIDVIVSDQRMPGMLGVELLKEVKRISPNTVRILLTGYSDLNAIIDSVNAGEIFRYINKPWQSSKLKETVALACEYADRLKTAPQPAPRTTSASAGLLQALGVSQIPDTHKEHLLFVNPKPANLQAYRQVLGQNYIVHTAESAAQAFVILKSQPISVLISEINLPDTSAADFLVAVAAEKPDVVTILLSDSRDASIAVRLINEAQVFRYLIKPMQRELLKSTIELAISRHHALVSTPQINTRAYMGVKGVAALSQGDSKSLEEAVAKVREILKARVTY
ncbi:MAG: response regulator [Chloroherpetonaceae bacterium]|nr:response regulator [Chloroherpetonaceae bacterium]